MAPNTLGAATSPRVQRPRRSAPWPSHVRRLSDYIGGENYEEACDALSSRKRLTGVERRADPEALEAWMVEGHL